MSRSDDTPDHPPVVVNVDDAPLVSQTSGAWGAAFKGLTPSMRPRGGMLGVNQMRVAPGNTTCPFHFHVHEDEVFFIQSGRGVLRYGDSLTELRPGDCVSCPAGTKVAHQICNPFDEDLVYLAIGNYDPAEVCVYPDNGKTLVRSIGQVGFLEQAPYLAGEPDQPTIFALAREAGIGGAATTDVDDS